MHSNVLLLVLQYLILHRPHDTIANPLFGNRVVRAHSLQFPFVVCIIAIFDGPENESDIFPDDVVCTGTLISMYHVLTAEHCSGYTATHRVQVIIGSTDVRLGRRHNLFWWITHNQWAIRQHRRTRYRLLRRATRFIAPSELSTARRVSLFRSEAALVGWGELAEGQTTIFMHTGNVTIISDSDCLDLYTRLTNERATLPLGEMCSLANPFVILGKGDSGGPVLQGNTIVGVSTSITPDIGTPPEQANVHASVHFYRVYISEQLQM